MSKYDLTYNLKKEGTITLYQVRALRDIPLHGVRKGDLGGYIQSQANLSQSGECWVAKEAVVLDSATIEGDALVTENARVYGNAKVRGTVFVGDTAKVYEDALVEGACLVTRKARIHGFTKLAEDVEVWGGADIAGYTNLSGRVHVYGNAILRGKNSITGKCQIKGDARVRNVTLSGSVSVRGNAELVGNPNITLSGSITVTDDAQIKGEPFLYGKITLQEQANIEGNVSIDAVEGNLKLRGTSSIEELVELKVTVHKTLLNERIAGDLQLVFSEESM